MPDSILFTGGARSGKSSAAQTWIRAHGTAVYLATARRDTTDPEMEQRIRRHQQDRAEAGWRTIECHEDVPAAIHGAAPAPVLVDCVTLWLTALGERHDWDDTPILSAMDRLAAIMAAPPGPLAVVTNEVGLGVIPPTALGRRFQDLQGWANQRLAAEATTVVFMACGLPMVLKGSLPQRPDPGWPRPPLAARRQASGRTTPPPGPPPQRHDHP